MTNSGEGEIGGEGEREGKEGGGQVGTRHTFKLNLAVFISAIKSHQRLHPTASATETYPV